MPDGAVEFSDEDDRFYSIIAEEVAAGHTDKMLAIKAFALCDGEPTKTKAAYYRMRAHRLKKMQDPAFSAQTHETPENGDATPGGEGGVSIPVEIQNALRQAYSWLDRLGSVLVEDTYRAEHNRLGVAFDCQYESEKIGNILRKHGLLPKDSSQYFGQNQDAGEPDTTVMTIVVCTNCQQQLRVPNGKVLDITCPNCHRVFRQET